MQGEFSDFRKAGVLVDFNYAFSEKKLQFVYLENQTKFNELLNKYKSKILSQKVGDDNCLYYYLNNSMVLVSIERTLLKRYFICASEKDYDFIKRYCGVLFSGERLIVFSISHDRNEIKEFMIKERPEEKREDNKNLSDSPTKVFKTRDSKCVISTINFFSDNIPGITKEIEGVRNRDFDFVNSNYIDCFVFNSFNDAYSFGMLNKGEYNQEIDHDNFKTLSKKLVLNYDTTLDIKVINRKIAKGYLRENSNSSNTILSKEGFPSLGIKVKGGKVMQRYNEQIYMLLKNGKDAVLFKDKMEKYLANRPNEDFDFFQRRIVELLKNSEINNLQFRKHFSLQADISDWRAALKELDKKLEKYFCDRFFVSAYFSSLVVYCGSIIINSFHGNWNNFLEDKEAKMVIILPDRKEVDFIPYLLESLKESKYGGVSLIYGSVELSLAHN